MKGIIALDYYSALIILSWMSLGVLCVLISENSWIPRANKGIFYLTYGLIAVSALAEWLGVQMAGRPDVPHWVLSLVKCLDYTLTPMAGGALVGQMRLKNRWLTAMFVVLAANMVFQIIAAFNGWMIVIDEANRYTHTPLYLVYVTVYMIVIALVAVEFLIFGRSFYHQNQASLYAALAVVVSGIAIQELSNRSVRIAYAALTMGAALMYIHYQSFYQSAADEHIRQQQREIMQDVLTGVNSRNAYEKAIALYEGMPRLPDSFATFTIDLNGLKAVNDNYGHDVGDQLIIGAARCIESAVGKRGKCYRTGGDEFVVLANMDRSQADAALAAMENQSQRYTAKSEHPLNLSAGYALACDHASLSAKQLVHESDQAMYAAKAAFYRKTGNDRRT